MNSIYLHIPFCQSRCIYCDFYSTTLGQDVMTAYVDALIREMSLREHYIYITRAQTVYLGGGTPSLLPPPLLGKLFDAILRLFPLDDDAEVTIEANPDDVTPQWLSAIKAATPVNRISMGAQTFDDKLLALIGRRHNALQTIQAAEACQKAGLTNISLDLIYGLPSQTLAQWQHDVEQAISLGIKHLSAYALSFEEGTRLTSMLEKGQIHEADEELSLAMYRHLIDKTRQAGFRHYEISNFALPGHHSRHNSSYWQGTPYLGIGAGAHSYDGRRSRRANLPDIKAYIAAKGDVPHQTELLDDNTLYNEFVMTRLRTAEGIPLELLSEGNRNYCLANAQSHISHGRLRIQQSHLKLTSEGIFTSNNIISDLMKA